MMPVSDADHDVAVRMNLDDPRLWDLDWYDEAEDDDPLMAAIAAENGSER